MNVCKWLRFESCTHANCNFAISSIPCRQYSSSSSAHLAAAQLDASIADACSHAVGQLIDEMPSLGASRRFVDFRLARISEISSDLRASSTLCVRARKYLSLQFAIANIVVDWAVEERRLLTDESNARAQVIRILRAHINAIKFNLKSEFHSKLLRRNLQTFAHLRSPISDRKSEVWEPWASIYRCPMRRQSPNARHNVHRTKYLLAPSKKR